MNETQAEMPSVRSRGLAAVRWDKLIDTLASMCVIVAAGIFVWTTLKPTTAPARAPIPVPSEPQPLQGAQTIGNVTAPAGMIVYSDFECPFCASFATGPFRDLKAEYVDTGRLLVGFRNFPLEEIHPHAREAAAAAACAATQGRFWEMHDRIFSRRVALDYQVLRQSAPALSLDGSAWDRSLTSEVIRSTNATEASSARALSFTGTPTLLVGRNRGGFITATKVLAGVSTIDQLRTFLDPIVAPN